MIFPSPDAISAAVDRIDPVMLDMPARSSAALDALLGATLVFKDETANPIRSFKGRGACNFAAGLAPHQSLVCGSAGNFGQGLAWAARRDGHRLTVFAATGAVRVKVAAMRALGAEVRLGGIDYDAAKVLARDFAEREGLVHVEDGAEPRIAEGAGTLARELTRDHGPLDAVLVPLGNGALASGVGAWFKHAAPATRVIAVAAQGAPAMAHAVLGASGDPAPRADTIADGIAVRVPIPYAVASVRDVVDDVVLVRDDDIRRAMRLIGEHLQRAVEPAGAAGLAAVIADRPRWRGLRIAVPLCGGNIDSSS